MISMEELSILNVSLNQSFKSPSTEAELLLLHLPDGVWLLADMRTPAGQRALPPVGAACTCVEARGLDRFLQLHTISANRRVSTEDSGAIEAHLFELHQEFTGAARSRAARLQMLLGLVLLDFQQLNPPDVSASEPPEDRLEAAIQRMLFEYNRPWRVETLSELIGISPSYLNRLCRRKYGMSPIDMLIDHRITIAKRFLLLPGAKVSAVCEAVGFSDTYYFSRVFKKRCSVTPTEYMKNAPDRSLSPSSRSIPHPGAPRTAVPSGGCLCPVNEGAIPR